MILVLDTTLTLIQAQENLIKRTPASLAGLIRLKSKKHRKGGLYGNLSRMPILPQQAVRKK